MTRCGASDREGNEEDKGKVEDGLTRLRYPLLYHRPYLAGRSTHRQKKMMKKGLCLFVTKGAYVSSKLERTLSVLLSSTWNIFCVRASMSGDYSGLIEMCTATISVR